jgi:hypothetical protein
MADRQAASIGGLKVKARQIIKTISLTTALGVFLTGCGGGPDSTDTNSNARTTTNTTTNPSTSTPVVNPVTSGGSGSIGFTANDTIDQVAQAQKDQSDKLDKAISELQKNNKQNKSNSTKITAILGLSAAAVAAMLIHNINTGAKVGAKKGFLSGLWHGTAGDDTPLAEVYSKQSGEDTKSAVIANDNANAGGIHRTIDRVAVELNGGQGDIKNAVVSQTPHIMAAKNFSAAGAKFAAEASTNSKKAVDGIGDANGKLDGQARVLDEQGKAAVERGDAQAETSKKIADSIQKLKEEVDEADKTKITAEQFKAMSEKVASLDEDIKKLPKKEDVTALSTSLQKVDEQLRKIKKATKDAQKVAAAPAPAATVPAPAPAPAAAPVAAQPATPVQNANVPVEQKSKSPLPAAQTPATTSTSGTAAGQSIDKPKKSPLFANTDAKSLIVNKGKSADLMSGSKSDYQ